MSPLPAVKTFDPSQVTGNYLAARGAQQSTERQNVLGAQRETTFQNALVDRERKIGQEDKSFEAETRMKKIAEDDAWHKKGMDIALQIDTDADDETFQEQVSQIPDALGARMSDLGYTPQEIRQTTSKFFKSGIWSKQGIRAIQEKSGLRKAAPSLTGDASNLEIILGRKPSVKELKDYKKTSGGSGQMPADAKMVDYMVSNKIAPDKKTAFNMVQMSKSDPVRLVNDMVKTAEAAQTANMVSPGDEGYKDRQALINESQQMVMDIRKSFTSGQGDTDYNPQHTPGGMDPNMAATGGGQPPPAQGSEPVPQTQADFDALAPGAVYRDPDDGKLYTK